MRSDEDLELFGLHEVGASGNLANEKIQQEAALGNELAFHLAHRSLFRNRRYVESGPAIDKQFTKRVKVTVAAEYLKLALPVVSDYRVDDMVHALWFLGVGHAPLTDVLNTDEALLDSEFAFILLQFL